MKGDALRGHLELLVLAALGDGDAHGYGIIEHIRERSQGEFDLAEGSVYPALYRLEKSRLVASDWTSEGGRRRRVYSLTAIGRLALSGESARFERLVRGVRAVTGGAA